MEKIVNNIYANQWKYWKLYKATADKNDHVNENLNQLWTTANKALQLAQTKSTEISVTRRKQWNFEQQH